ncbi:uncharacterized protein LOC114748633 [Neltuma alba]|uniref:uncharacterized protein LOC114748633 n=1 Tax=Neltuma alba TaxID=207710 RepID=UPI0010A50B89|nr:uncharacterized protein LOC114748633 [Prosopis alba]
MCFKFLQAQHNTMEENPNACKNPIAAANIPSNSSSSHFISIAMRDHSKLSMKIPRLMDKTMHSRSRRTKRGYQFPKKVVSVFFSSLFGKKRSLGTKDEDHTESESFLGRSDSQHEKEKNVTAEGNGLVHENQRIVGPLSQLIELELDDALEPHDAEEGKQEHGVLPLASFVDGNKSHNGEAAGDRTDVVSGWGLLRIKVRSCRLVRVVSRIVTITSWLKKKAREEVELEDDGKREEEEEEACLWKKRILMGGRCKPLYSSGGFQYDSDGILIPDLFL